VVVNNLFIDPPIYYGYDTIIGGRVATILSEIDILQSPEMDLLQGPFKNLLDFNKFQNQVRDIQDGLQT